MKNLKIDLFKSSIVLILIGFLYCFHSFAQNGRYVHENDRPFILDTRTGKVHTIKTALGK